jgi:hypothetical protein
MKNRLSTIIIIITLSLILITLSACGSAGLAAPTGLAAEDADPDNPNRIVLSWLPVDGADIYYVYRDTAAGGTFSTNAGLSVTSRVDSDGITRYGFMETFEEGEGGTYYYRVTAYDYSAAVNPESAKSTAVKALTYSGTWSAADPTVLGAAAQLSLSATTNALYAVYGTTTISAKKYTTDADSTADPKPKIWTTLAGPIGSADTTGKYRTLTSMMNGNELHVLFSDETSKKMSMQYYHDSSTGDEDPSFSWIDRGTITSVDIDLDGLSSVASGVFTSSVYGVFLEGGSNDVLKLYEHNSTTELWNNIDLIDHNIPTDASSSKLIIHNNTMYIGYENNDVDNPGLYLRKYADSTLQAEADGEITTSNIDDGNAVFVSGGGDLYAVYILAAGGLKVRKFENSSWSDLTEIATVPFSSPPGTLAAHWYNGFLYVFYVDSGDKGWVKYYSETDGWQNAQRNSTIALTESSTGLGSFQLASNGTELYAGYIEGGNAYVRILK